MIPIQEGLDKMRRHSLFSRACQRGGFTLLEIALSIGILSIGLTAVVSVYILALSWTEEIRVNLTALKTGRAVLADAGILMDKNRNPLDLSNRDEEAKGWANNYFMVRSYDPSESIALDNDAGLYIKVKVEVYTGGDDTDGLLVHQIFCHQILPREYK